LFKYLACVFFLFFLHLNSRLFTPLAFLNQKDNREEFSKPKGQKKTNENINGNVVVVIFKNIFYDKIY